MVEKDLVFIVSAGRTGTMFLGRNLSRMIDGCFSAHEPDVKYGWTEAATWRNIAAFGVWHMIVGRALGRTGALRLARDHLAGRLSHEEAVRSVRASRARYLRRRREPLIVECNYQWSPLLPVLRDAFPKAKVVAITRDQEAWVRSLLRLGTRHTDRDPVSPEKRLTPVTLRDPELGPRWASMTAEEKLRWEWQFLHGFLVDFAEQDTLARVYRFEDLFISGDREAVFKDMLEFVATHGTQRYPIHFDPTALDERINESVAGIKRKSQNQNSIARFTV